MGNSFAHLPDFDGDQSSHRHAIENFHECLRPGGILVIDHRNYDYICAGGKAPMKNIYYSVRLALFFSLSALLITSGIPSAKDGIMGDLGKSLWFQTEIPFGK